MTRIAVQCRARRIIAEGEVVTPGMPLGHLVVKMKRGPTFIRGPRTRGTKRRWKRQRQGQGQEFIRTRTRTRARVHKDKDKDKGKTRTEDLNARSS